MHRLTKFLCSFLLFLVLVFLPILYDGLILLALDIEERHMGAGLLENGAALFNLAWNAFFWFLVYIVFYWICYILYGRLSILLKLDSALLDILFVCMLALFVYSFGLKFFPVSGYSYMVGFLYLYEYVFWVGAAFFIAFLCLEFYLSASFRYVCSGFLLVFLFPWVVDCFYGGEARDYDSEHKSRSNVIVIGVDSLSAAAFERHRGELASLDRLAAQGDVYTRAYTNLGRTYPAWVTFLTGRYPKDHGAFFNLRDTAISSSHSNLARTLGEDGYHTVYAMDERRFSNLDESFGFDAVVGPRVGAVDFVVHPLMDTPITNLVLQWPGSKYIFPWSWNNVAAYSSYSKKLFVDEVVSNVKAGVPNFVVVHFETAHFPFRSRYAVSDFEHDNELWGRYIRTLQVVDGQIERLMRGLEERGLLDDALVVLFSDHGEGLGEVEAMVEDGQGEHKVVSSFGHGVNLLSDHQNRIMLGAVRFKKGRVVGGEGEINSHVSIVDLRSAIEGYVNNGEFKVLSDNSCFFVETGIRLSAADDYNTLDEREVARQAASFYFVDKRGRLVLRESSVYKLATRKDIGLRCPHKLTWYDYAKDGFFSFELGSDGLPVKSVKAGSQEVDKIKSYMEGYADKFESKEI